MRFDRKIYFGFGLILTAFIPLILVAFVSLHKLISEQHSLVAVHATELNLAELLRFEKESQFSAMPVYILGGDLHMLDKFNLSHIHFQNYMAKMAEVSNDPRSLALLENLRRSESQLYKLTEPIVALKRKGTPTTVINTFIKRSGGRFSEEVNQTLDELVTYETNEFEAARVAARKTSTQIFEGLVLSTILVLLFALFISALMIKVVRQKHEEDRNKELQLAQAKALSNARKETIEVVSHDLKNPLATIRMSTEMIMDRLERNEMDLLEFAQCLKMITRSTGSMESLIGNLLDHAKIEAGHLVIESVPCNVAGFIEDIVKRHDLLASGKGIHLSFIPPENSPLIRCDRARIEQVLFNLLGNAIKFTPKGGEVKVAMTLQGNDLRVGVHDSGPGIAADSIPHIFERYWQANESAKTGTGLGLSIAKAIVGAHNGKIWVESEPQKGCSFYFTLPNVQPSA
ncbi:MAG: sensor histidine kinase [Bdellovibrionales bacterium]